MREVLVEKIEKGYYTNDGDLWFENFLGQFHREGDRPAIISRKGERYWLKNGIKHRDGNKPAVIRDSGLEWWINGKKIK